MWVLDSINASAAWQVSQGQGVTVAVIDSGVNPGVSDLAGSVTTGPDLTGASSRPRSAACRRRWSGSWAVDGAISTSGSLPGGSSTSSAGGSHISGPTTWA